jgi:hypothetical protein
MNLDTNIDELFERRIIYPDGGPRERLAALVGLDEHKARLTKAATAHLVDCEGKFRDQIDVVVFDRQYSPFIFRYEGQTIVPAESVYAAFEAKQTTIDRHSVLACGRHRQRAGSDRAELWRVPQHEFDPGYAMVNVAKRWSADDFNDFMTQVKSSAASARAALDSPDENESKKLWRRLFGSTFGQ